MDEIEVEDTLTVSDEPTTVRLILLRNVNLKIKGPISGTDYVFGGAGAAVDVDSRDAEIFLTKQSQHPCCSGRGPSRYFEIAR